MIDFIQQLTAGFDYPGLALALDPVTIALLVGQGVQQVGKIREANQAEKRAAKQQQRGKDLYDKMLSDFQSGEYDLSLSQDVRDSAEQQRMLAEQFADAASQRGQAQLQSSLAAARYGDPRAAALIPRQAQQIEQGIQQAELQGLQQKVQSDARLAGMQQNIDAQNQRMLQELGSMQLKRGAADMDAGTLAEAQAQQARTQAQAALAASAAQAPFAFMMEEEDPNTKNLLSALNQFEQGGNLKFANKPGEVHMTGGEFSHKTNKKALVDEETGVKEAELTGDEAMVTDGENVLVFNPNQQSTIEGLVNKGDSKGLMKKMKALLKKFNKQDV
jgi:hypothetical protein